MAPLQRMQSRRGGASASSSNRRQLFGWDFMANYFDFVPPEVRKEILLLESKEFGGRVYFSYSNLGGVSLKWILDLGKL